MMNSDMGWIGLGSKGSSHSPSPLSKQRQLPSLTAKSRGDVRTELEKRVKKEQGNKPALVSNASLYWLL